jgi:hypothetical protein
MSIPTVNSLALSVMREFGESSDNVNLVAQVEEWVRDGYDEIGIKANWKYLFLIESLVTVVSQRLYNLAGVLDQEIACINTQDNTPLEKKERQELMEKGVNLSLTGKPLAWYVESFDITLETFTIGLYPVPDTIYTLQFLGLLQPKELSSTDKLFFPREFIFLLKDSVRIRFKEDDKDYTGASKIQSRFNENILRLKQRNDAPMALRPRMQIQDIAHSAETFVRLPPDHFTN